MSKILIPFIVGLILLGVQQCSAASTTTNQIGPEAILNLALLNQKKDLDDEQYAVILSKWVDQGRIKALDVATTVFLREAKTPIDLANLVKLEGILNTQIAARDKPLNARVDFVAATNNFSFSLTNQPTVLSNLAGSFSNQRLLLTNITILPGSPDADAYNALTNNWGNVLAAETKYTDYVTNRTSSPYFAFFSSGAEFLNPYVISVPHPTPNGFGTLTNSGNSTVAFLEFDWIYRHVVRPDNNDTSQHILVPDVLGGAIVNPLTLTPDFQYNVGFLLGNGGNLTNNSYSAQALAGSDFYTEFTVGLPIWRNEEENVRQQISIEFSGGVTTESSFQIVHPNGFVGGGYSASFRPFVGVVTTNSCGFFYARAGIARISTPTLVGYGNLVRLDGNGVPVFGDRNVPEVSTFLAYPLTPALYMIVDANAFFGDTQPNSWNIKVGASIPIEKIAGILR